MAETRSASLDEINTDECRELLDRNSIGRLVMATDKYPLVYPVMYEVDGDTIVFRTGRRPILEAAEHANVAFEIDGLDLESQAAWSVVVNGLAEESSDEADPELANRSRRAGVTPWVSTDRHWIRVIPQSVTGRRVYPVELP